MTPFLMLTLALPAAAADGLSLSQALSQALTHHPDLIASELSLDAAEAGADLARAAWDPALSAGAGLSSGESQSYLAGALTSTESQGWTADLGLQGELPTGTALSVRADLAQDSSTTTSALSGGVAQETSTVAASVGLSASQDLLALLRPSASAIAVRQAREAASQAQLSLLAARQSALAEVATAWWTWDTATRAVDVARRAVDDALALEQVTAAQVEEGLTEPVELHRVAAERLAAQIALQVQQDEADADRDTLLLLIGEAPGAEVQPQGDVTLPPLEATALAPHLALAQAQSPSLALAALQVDAAEAAARDVRWDRLPSLTLSGSAGLASLDSDAGAALRALGGDSAFPSLGADLQLTVPLGGRAGAARQARAEAELSSKTILFKHQEQTLEADLRAALRAVVSDAQRVALSEARLEVARLTEQGEQARVDEGTRRLQQLLDATHARQDAEVDVLDARLALATARLQLAALEGGVDALLVR